MIDLTGLISEGRTKRVQATGDPELAVMYFKDEAIAYRGLKRGRILGKGEVNNEICGHLFTMLAEKGVPNHYIEKVDARQCLVKRIEMIPIEVKVRNSVAGTLAERIGLPVGTPLRSPIVECLLKIDGMEDPLVNSSHIMAMGIAERDELEQMYAMALKVNDILSAYTREIGVELVDVKLEFGRWKGQLLLGDEITPDTARFRDIRTGESLDIDRFRRDMGDAMEGYLELLHRMMGYNG